MQVTLEGKVALVTGASKGIGRAIAAGMAEAGASVMLSSRKLDQLEQAAAGIDGDVAVFPANAGQIDAAEACVAATIERFGRLDILVNNAATNPYYGRHARRRRRRCSTRRSRSTCAVRSTGRTPRTRRRSRPSLA